MKEKNKINMYTKYIEDSNIIEIVLDWLFIAKPDWKTREDSSQIDTNEKNLLINIIKEEVNELEVALANNNMVEIKDAVSDIIYTSLNSIAASGIHSSDMIKYFNNVTKSNYSKYCVTQKEAKDSVRLYKEGKHPTKIGEKIDCYYKAISHYYVIFRTSDNKIMKSIYFKEPDYYNQIKDD